MAVVVKDPRMADSGERGKPDIQFAAACTAIAGMMYACNDSNIIAVAVAADCLYRVHQA